MATTLRWVPLISFPAVVGCMGLSCKVCSTPPAPQGSGTWLPLASMQVARQETGAAAFSSTEFCVVGGLTADGSVTETVEAYNVHTDTWRFAAPLPAPRDHMAVVSVAGRVYVIGGYAGHFQAVSDTFIASESVASWTAGPSLPEGRGAPWAVAINDRIYLFGGVDPNGQVRRTTFILNTTTNTWSTGADMPTAREHLNAVALDGFVYVVGGRNGAASSANERYDPVTDTWQSLTPMPTARSAMALAAIGGRLVAAGGEVPQLHAVTEVYDPATNTWSSDTDMLVPRHGIAVVTFGEHAFEFFAPGGGTQQGLEATSYHDRFVVPVGSSCSPPYTGRP